jgi:hypothetical protein
MIIRRFYAGILTASHARASFQSRITVPIEVFLALACLVREYALVVVPGLLSR